MDVPADLTCKPGCKREPHLMPQGEHRGISVEQDCCTGRHSVGGKTQQAGAHGDSAVPGQHSPDGKQQLFAGHSLHNHKAPTFKFKT